MPKGADAVVIQENTEVSATSQVYDPAAGAAGAECPERAGSTSGAARRCCQRARGSTRATSALPRAANAGSSRVRAQARGGALRHRGRTGAAGQEAAARPDRLLQQPCARRHGRAFRGEVVNLGIVPDNLKATERAIARAARADILLTTGGASVGDHDYVQEALEEFRRQDRLLEDRHAAGQALHVWPQRAASM